MFKQAPVIQSRLADDVYEQILSAIVNGDIAPGERLIQEKIASQINISRTPVREALLRLEQEGILEISGRKGFSIRKIAEDEVRQLYAVREAIEGYAARQVAEHKDPEHLAAIKLTVDAELEEDLTDVEVDFRVNRTIHRTIVEQTNNPMLLDMFDRVWGRGVSLWLFAATRSDQGPLEPVQHQDLFATLSTADPDTAQRAMIDHIRDGLDRQLKGL
jgi:DNA-binding GntR family transcriptional regulator